MTGVGYALKRVGVIYGVVAAIALVVGILVATLGDHALLLTLAVTFYVTAGASFVLVTLTQTRSRKTWQEMTDSEREHAFGDEMWLFVVVVALALTGGLFHLASAL